MDTSILKSAIYRSARKSTMKPKQIADAMEIPYQQFLNKTCMTTDSANLTFYETVELESITGARHIHHAVGTLLGEHSVPISAGDPGGLMAAVLQASVDHGDVHRVIRESIENDRKIDAVELQTCVEAIAGVIKSFLQLQAELIDAEKNKTIIE